MFLQEPTQHERADWQPEPTPTEAPDTDQDQVDTVETATDQNQDSAAAPERDDAVFQEADQQAHTNTSHAVSHGRTHQRSNVASRGRTSS